MADALATYPSLKSPLVPSGRRVGIDPISAVYLMEDHDEALQVWQRGNVSNRILLHIDAHIDFDWIPEKSPSDLLSVSSFQELEILARQKIFWNLAGRKEEFFVHIGNYICLALRQGIVRTFYWVTPEAPPGVSWEKEMLNLLRDFHRQHPSAFKEPHIEGKRLSAELYGFPLIVCTLKDLPPIEEEVLLDIDTDFLISGFLTKEGDPRLKKPWLFPEALIETLRSKGIQSDCVTIAFSVEGGFTPLSYKYFGDALAQFIRDPSLDRRLYEYKRSAQVFEANGKIEEAMSEYRKALQINPKDAASLYNLALLLLQENDIQEASRLYREAVVLDPTYATAYNNWGPVYGDLGQWEKAEDEFEKMFLLDPENAETLCGLGDVHRSRKKFPQALFYYEKALAKNPTLARAYEGQGYLYFAQRKWDQALSAFESALQRKGREAALKFWIGSTLLKKKEFRQAKVMLLEAARLGLRAPALRRRLLWIHFRESLHAKRAKEANRSTDVFQKSERVSWRFLEEQVVLVDQNQGKVVRLTPTGAAIWEALDGQKNIQEIVTRICENFEADPEQVRQDVFSFLKQLKKQGFVEPKRFAQGEKE